MGNRICITIAAVALAAVTAVAQAQVTRNVYQRVLELRVNAGTDHEGTATAFTIDVDGREYLITAKHVVKDLKANNNFDVFMNGAWTPLTVKVFTCDDPIDIAVLIPPHQLTVDLPVSWEGNWGFGQEAYFLGFPHEMQIPGQGLNGPYPLALIKRGTISGSMVVDAQRKASRLLLDGYNNPGFSGGPIVYRDLYESGSTDMKVLGVVSGFYPEVVPVMKEHDIAAPAFAGAKAKSEPWRIWKRKKNGTYFEDVDNGTFVALNTGIVEGYGIAPAIDLIRQHPIGPEVKNLPGNDPGTLH